MKCLLASLIVVLLMAAASFPQQSADELLKIGVKNAESGRLDEAIQNFTEVINLNPRNADAYLYRGSIYFQKRLREPEPSYEEKVRIAGEIKPGETAPKSPTSLKAIADLTKAIELAPNVPNGYAARGMVYKKEEDYEPAVEDFKKFLALVPGEPQAKSELADAEKKYVSHLMTQGTSLGVRAGNMPPGPDRDKERLRIAAIYSTVLKIEPDNVLAVSYRGEAYRNAGQFELAVGDFTRQLTLKPGDKDALMNRAESNLALKAYDAARKDFDMIIQLPDTPENEFDRAKGFKGRGEVALGQNNPGAAIKDFNESVRIRPQYQVALHLRGMAFLKQGDKERAVADFKKVLEMNPNSPQAKQTAIELQRLGIK